MKPLLACAWLVAFYLGVLVLSGCTPSPQQAAARLDVASEGYTGHFAASCAAPPGCFVNTACQVTQCFCPSPAICGHATIPVWLVLRHDYVPNPNDCLCNEEV